MTNHPTTTTKYTDSQLNARNHLFRFLWLLKFKSKAVQPDPIFGYPFFVTFKSVTYDMKDLKLWPKLIPQASLDVVSLHAAHLGVEPASNPDGHEA